MPSRRTVDIQDGDEKWTEEFASDIRHLCGLVEEAFEENKTLLLSPVMRELIRNHGRKVKDKLDRVNYHICIDNLGEPLGK